MRHSGTFSLYALVGVFSLLALPWVACAQGKYTDFRGKSSYSSTDLEKALFPDSAVQPGSVARTRGVEPAMQKPLSQSPAPTVTPVQTKAAIAINVFFETNSAKILPQYYDDLDKLGEALSRRSDAHVQIEGHTDSRGSDMLNQSLSERRAESIKQYLVEKFALSSEHIATKGLGAAQPRETNDTAQGRQVNRRVEVVNLGLK